MSALASTSSRRTHGPKWYQLSHPTGARPPERDERGSSEARQARASGPADSSTASPLQAAPLSALNSEGTASSVCASHQTVLRTPSVMVNRVQHEWARAAAAAMPAPPSSASP